MSPNRHGSRHGRRHERLGLLHRIRQRPAAGQQRGRGGGKRAAGAVRLRGTHSRHVKVEHGAPHRQHIGDAPARQVPPFPTNGTPKDSCSSSAAVRSSSSVVMRRPRRISASGRFGVTRRASGISSRQSVAIAPACGKCAPEADTMTGSATRFGIFSSATAEATARMIAAE